MGFEFDFYVWFGSNTGHHLSTIGITIAHTSNTFQLSLAVLPKRSHPNKAPLHVPLFSHFVECEFFGENYHLWAIKIGTYLSYQSLWDIVENESNLS
ncbi:hypothetical protein CR513_40069, partial [Mucuna pruriens]